MSEDLIRDGEWVNQRLIEAHLNRERHLRAIRERNDRLRVEILQYAVRDSFR